MLKLFTIESSLEVPEIQEKTVPGILSEVWNILKMGWRSIVFFFADNFSKLISVVLVILIGTFVIKIINRVLRKALEKTKIHPNLWHPIRQATKVILIVILLSIVAMILGVLPAFSAVIASAGFALSLALKDNLANYISGIILLTNHTYSIGDMISVEENRGKVVKIGFHYTELLTMENERVYIPNSIVTQSAVMNQTEEGKRCVHLTYTLRNTSKLDESMDKIEQIVKKSSLRIQKEPVSVSVKTVRLTTVEVSVTAWVKVAKVTQYRADMGKRIQKLLASEEEPLAISENSLD